MYTGRSKGVASTSRPTTFVDVNGHGDIQDAVSVGNTDRNRDIEYTEVNDKLSSS